MPNITGTFKAHCFTNGTTTVSGALKDGEKTATSYGQSGTSPSLAFDASGSNAIYGNSTTVTPVSRKCKFFIRWKNSVGEGLPNIVGTQRNGNALYVNEAHSGALNCVGAGNGAVCGKANGSFARLTLHFDASWSNAIYGSSAHVTPLSSTCMYIINTRLDAGLPNITGEMTSQLPPGWYNTTRDYSGFFERTTTTGSQDTVAVAGQVGLWYISADASNCSTIYGNSATVTPKSVKVKYFIRWKK